MDITCSICLESLIGKGDVSAVLCGHVYHTNCITSWIKEKRNCPQCRHAAAAYRLLRLFFERPTQGQAAPSLSMFLAVVAESSALKKKQADLEDAVETLEVGLREANLMCSELIEKHEQDSNLVEEKREEAVKEAKVWQSKFESQVAKNRELCAKIVQLREDRTKLKEYLATAQEQRREYRRRLELASRKMSDYRKKIRGYEKSRIAKRKKMVALIKQRAAMRKKIHDLERLLVVETETDSTGTSLHVESRRKSSGSGHSSPSGQKSDKTRTSASGAVWKLYEKATHAFVKQANKPPLRKSTSKER